MESNQELKLADSKTPSSPVLKRAMLSEPEYHPSLNILFPLLRVFALLTAIIIFVPGLNPARISVLVNKTQSMLTSGISFGQLTREFIRPVQKGWIDLGSLRLLYFATMGGWLGIAISGIGTCFSLGELKLKRLGLKISAGGAAFSVIMTSLIYIAYKAFLETSNASKIMPQLPIGLPVVLFANGLILFLSLGILMMLPKSEEDAIYEMQPKYRLFLMMLPFLALTFVFCYLPLWFWSVSFFDYKAGFALTADKFVGFKWITYMIQNPSTRADILRVLRNTLAMSGIGLGTSWMAMAFAVLLMEIKRTSYRRIIQTLTTIPNFISWVLIYTFALAIFSSEGFANTVLQELGIIDSPIQFLQKSSHIWIKMWAWGMWKGLGWSAIIYIAAITGIDPQLFEAATVDGAGRFRRIWHITIPSLLPTFFVLLLLGIANILSNGMDQYFVFKNAMNKNPIEVLDLYVYTLGLGSGGASNIALATLVGFLKSIISVTLLFAANKASKIIRGESIV